MTLWLNEFYFPPQQHHFFTSHEAKETDVASFVKVILGDWVATLSKKGDRLNLLKRKRKKKQQQTNTQTKSTNRSPCYLQDSFLPLRTLTPPSRNRQTESRGEADEAEWGAPTFTSMSPVDTWHGSGGVGEGKGGETGVKPVSFTHNLE